MTARCGAAQAQCLEKVRRLRSLPIVGEQEGSRGEEVAAEVD